MPGHPSPWLRLPSILSPGSNASNTSLDKAEKGDHGVVFLSHANTGGRRRWWPSWDRRLARMPSRFFGAALIMGVLLLGMVLWSLWGEAFQSEGDLLHTGIAEENAFASYGAFVPKHQSTVLRPQATSLPNPIPLSEHVEDDKNDEKKDNKEDEKEDEKKDDKKDDKEDDKKDSKEGEKKDDKNDEKNDDKKDDKNYDKEDGKKDKEEQKNNDKADENKDGKKDKQQEPKEDANPDPKKEAINQTIKATISRALASPPFQGDSLLSCPAINKTRYNVLKAPFPSSTRLYFFALDLRNVAGLLPQLMGSVLSTIDFLGPHACALSIIEGNSEDGTFQILEGLRARLTDMGVVYDLDTSATNPKDGDRIAKLSELRNLALEPMMRDRRFYDETETTILFLNDVTACEEDLLELLYQRKVQNAHMMCATDWNLMGNTPRFYDTWIMRTINGDVIFPLWEHPSYMFWNELPSRARWLEAKPIQVFACWNGAVATTAEPYFRGLRFRRASMEDDVDECETGEPTLFNKDMWRFGYNRIAVVPSVTLGYDLNTGRRLKEVFGYASQYTEKEHEGLSPMIEWRREPPELVVCMPFVGPGHSWRPWYDGFPKPEKPIDWH